jgi:DNA gyrase subunit A
MVCVPKRASLKEVLEHFLKFRYQVVTRRLQYDLRKLEERIHILRGFAIIFADLDEAIKLIRASDGKKDARTKLMARYELDYEQAEAVLETKLYKLAKLEIDEILEELEEKEAAAAAIRLLLSEPGKLWDLVKSELEQIKEAYGDPRRTKVTGPVEEIQFSAEVYIIAEDGYTIVTKDGWVKRQKSYTDVSAIRVREEDEVRFIIPMSSRESLVLFTDQGRAYTLRGADIGMTTGYGEAIQTKFDFADGERIVGAATTDERTLPLIDTAILDELTPDDPMPPYVVFMTRGGKAARLSLQTFAEPSKRNGRIYARLDSAVANDAVVGATISRGNEFVSLATRQGKCLLFPVGDINVRGGASKGVAAIKLTGKDFVLGFELTTHRMHGLSVITSRGRDEVVRPNKFKVTSRGLRGREIIRQGTLSLTPRPVLELRFRSAEGEAEPDPGEFLAPPDSGQGSLLLPALGRYTGESDDSMQGQLGEQSQLTEQDEESELNEESDE